jgi:hypothetical protein
LNGLIKAEFRRDYTSATCGIVVKILLALSRTLTHCALVDIVHETVYDVIVFIYIHGCIFGLKWPHLLLSSGENVFSLLLSVVLACCHLRLWLTSSTVLEGRLIVVEALVLKDSL